MHFLRVKIHTPNFAGTPGLSQVSRVMQLSSSWACAEFVCPLMSSERRWQLSGSFHWPARNHSRDLHDSPLHLGGQMKGHLREQGIDAVH